MISIDPSWRGTGTAQFDNDSLLLKEVHLLSVGKTKLTWESMARLAGSLSLQLYNAHNGARIGIIEVPKVYPHSSKKSADGTEHNVDPNDIVRLAYLAGVLAPGVETVTPQEWKKQVPKKIHNQRVLSRLNEKERYLIEDYNCPAHLKHNVIDAVGLGLWKLGRM